MPFMNHVSTRKVLVVRDEYGAFEAGVCPECYDHEQGEAGEVHDCKNMFFEWEWVRGRRVMKPVGQCCCWSVAHGKRRGYY